MNAGLVLPDPQTVALSEVRTSVVPAAQAARLYLRESRDVAGARELTRRLEAFRKYLQDREGRDLLAAECRRTEVLIGHLLGPVGPGQRTDLEPSPMGEGSLSHNDRHKFRTLAAHEELLALGKVSRNVLLEKIERRDAVEDVPDVRTGDFRTVLDEVPDGSATLILTDPPYEQSALGLYGDLGKHAARLLRPGGSLICYTGQATMPEALARINVHLRYWWTLALTHTHGGQQLPGKWVMVEWKPVLWFVKDYRLGREYVADRLRGTTPEKSHHDWAQGIEEVQYLIERLTEPGELIVDPFAGSGSFGRAAVALDRRFVGADVREGGTTGVVA